MSEIDRDQRDGGRGEGRGEGRGRGRGGPGRGVPLSELDPELTETSHRVIGCARDIHVALGPGYDKSTYLSAMQAELGRSEIPFSADHAIDVRYKDEVVGRVTADLLIADRFIVEVMAEPAQIGSFERSALRAKLKSADLELGLIINFSGRLLKDGLVRVLNPDKLGLGRRAGERSAEAYEEHDGDDSDRDTVFE